MPELEQRIEAALDTIRDYLRTDGGDVRLVRVNEDYVVELELMGLSIAWPSHRTASSSNIASSPVRNAEQFRPILNEHKSNDCPHPAL